MPGIISNIISSVSDALKEMHPGYAIYDESIPQNFSKPAFLIKMVEHNYKKRMDNKFDGVLSLDTIYFPESKLTAQNDCRDMAEEISHNLDLIETFRVQSKNATIVDSVLHVTFDVAYSEVIPRTGAEMESLDVTSGIKEE